MQLASRQPALVFILLIGASFSCSQVALKRSLGISPSAVTANDDSNEDISTIETLSMEPAENTNESVNPPANISGSYLVCVEAQAATAESPDAVVNCGLRDNATSRKVDISAYASKVWTYRLEGSSPTTVLFSELTTSLEWHVAITLKGPSLGEVQTAQKSIKFF